MVVHLLDVLAQLLGELLLHARVLLLAPLALGQLEQQPPPRAQLVRGPPLAVGGRAREAGLLGIVDGLEQVLLVVLADGLDERGRGHLAPLALDRRAHVELGGGGRLGLVLLRRNLRLLVARLALLVELLLQVGLELLLLLHELPLRLLVLARAVVQQHGVVDHVDEHAQQRELVLEAQLLVVARVQPLERLGADVALRLPRAAALVELRRAEERGQHGAQVAQQLRPVGGAHRGGRRHLLQEHGQVERRRRLLLAQALELGEQGAQQAHVQLGEEHGLARPLERGAQLLRAEGLQDESAHEAAREGPHRHEVVRERGALERQRARRLGRRRAHGRLGEGPFALLPLARLLLLRFVQRAGQPLLGVALGPLLDRARLRGVHVALAARVGRVVTARCCRSPAAGAPLCRPPPRRSPSM